MQTSSAVSAAHLLLQSAEASLPKQKKNLAITEFKHAKVAFKRHSKSCQDAKGTVQLPQDVLIHIFSFLDMPSLVSVELVSWSWNLAASDNHLWHSQYTVFFGNYMNSSKTKVQQSNKVVKDKKHALLQEDKASQNCVDWREAFKRAYIGNSSKNLTSDRGFCGHCNAVVWLNNLKCSNVHCGLKSQKQIKHILPSQVVEYLLEDRLPMISSSDSDSESDEESISRLWAYPKHLQL